MAASAAAVLSWWEGHRPPAETQPDPRTLVGFLEHTARLQAVKCSPRGRRAGKPFSPMWRECPPRFLGEELKILQPGRVLVLGAKPREAVETIGVLVLDVDEPTFAHGTLTVADRQSELFWLPHPNNRRGGWERGQRQLLDHLTANR